MTSPEGKKRAPEAVGLQERGDVFEHVAHLVACSEYSTLGTLRRSLRASRGFWLKSCCAAIALGAAAIAATNAIGIRNDWVILPGLLLLPLVMGPWLDQLRDPGPMALVPTWRRWLRRAPALLGAGVGLLAAPMVIGAQLDRLSILVGPLPTLLWIGLWFATWLFATSEVMLRDHRLAEASLESLRRVLGLPGRLLRAAPRALDRRAWTDSYKGELELVAIPVLGYFALVFGLMSGFLLLAGLSRLLALSSTWGFVLGSVGALLGLSWTFVGLSGAWTYSYLARSATEPLELLEDLEPPSAPGLPEPASGLDVAGDGAAGVEAPGDGLPQGPESDPLSV